MYYVSSFTAFQISTTPVVSAASLVRVQLGTVFPVWPSTVKMSNKGWNTQRFSPYLYVWDLCRLVEDAERVNSPEHVSLMIQLLGCDEHMLTRPQRKILDFGSFCTRSEADGTVHSSTQTSSPQTCESTPPTACFPWLSYLPRVQYTPHSPWYYLMHWLQSSQMESPRGTYQTQIWAVRQTRISSLCWHWPQTEGFVPAHCVCPVCVLSAEHIR